MKKRIKRERENCSEKRLASQPAFHPLCTLHGRMWSRAWATTTVLALSFWQNIEYIVPTFASGCQYATYCNICKGWRGSTSHMLSIFARVRQGPACGQKPSNMGSENSSKSLRKRFQTPLNRFKSLKNRSILDFGTAALGRYSIYVNICK